jgi:hypothetical protein
MRARMSGLIRAMAVVVVAGWIGYASFLATAEVPATQTQPTDLGPDVVMLKELVNLYEPVPFDHKSHAGMAQMWEGCMTCHHRPPSATTRPASSLIGAPKTQEASAGVPACKSCHEVSAADGEIGMPNLKGAYHRQCLNCHRDWMHGNKCVVCHKPRESNLAGTQPAPTRDDIVGRMHPPIPEPDETHYRMRFTPADGGNVLFRHKEHTATYGFKCVTCHRKDSCAHCHDPKGDKTQQKPLHPGNTWADSHGPCMSCHQEQRCRHCHYRADENAPPLFSHQTTVQPLDSDHVKLGCEQCHVGWQFKDSVTCNVAGCHKPGRVIEYPKARPGPVAK